MSVDDYDLADLLPHAGRMILLEALEAVSEEGVRTRTRARRDDLFACESAAGAPAWMGMEYLAQSIAVWRGYHERRQGRPVRPGFLVGTRAFRSSVARIPWGVPLTVEARRLLQDPVGVSVFEGRVSGDGIEQTGRIKVYLPPDVATYLKEMAHD